MTVGANLLAAVDLKTVLAYNEFFYFAVFGVLPVLS